MQLLFSHTPGFAASTVAVLTRSRHSHVDFVVTPYTLFGALARSNVTGYHSYESRMAHAKNAVLMDIPLGPEQTRQMLEYLDAQKGKKYDWASCLTTFSVHNRDWKDEEKWMCSELAAAAFEKVNKRLVDADVISRVVPEDLYRLPFEKTLLKGRL